MKQLHWDGFFFWVLYLLDVKKSLIKSSSHLWIICLSLSPNLTRKGSFWKFSPFPYLQRCTELWILHWLTITYILQVGKILSFAPSFPSTFSHSFSLSLPPLSPSFQFIILQVYSNICAALALTFSLISVNLLPHTQTRLGHGGFILGTKSTAEHLLLFTLFLIPVINNLDTTW